MATGLDLEFVRAQFPAFKQPTLANLAFFENAGGSYPCGCVVSRLHEYYLRLKVQPYFSWRPSSEAGEWMDASQVQLARYLNVSSDEVNFGPSTSQNTYVLAQAFSKVLKPGDEVIVTNQDHEANTGVWRRLQSYGMVVKEWRVDPSSGMLDVSTLERMFTDRTRLLTFPHASNVIAHINPVEQITRKARAAGITTVVDGVSWAPHGLPDVQELGADAYLFSLYKTYGPHQGLMVIRRSLRERLGNEGHYFNASEPTKRLTPAGPDHAQIAAARGITDYFDILDEHHGGGDSAGRPQRVRTLLREAEKPLLSTLLDFLRGRKGLRLLGPTKENDRAATVAFVPEFIEPEELVRHLAERGFASGNGNFYAVRVLEAMGIDPTRGVTRISFVHYNTPHEMERLIQTLDAILPTR